MVAVINIQFLKSDTQMKSPAAKATLFLLPAFSEPIKPKQIQIHLLIQFRPIKFLPFFLGFDCSALPNRPSRSQGTRCYRLFWLRTFSPHPLSVGVWSPRLVYFIILTGRYREEKLLEHIHVRTVPDSTCRPF